VCCTFIAFRNEVSFNTLLVDENISLKLDYFPCCPLSGGCYWLYRQLQCTGSSRKTWQFLSYNKMKSMLSFYVNLLLKLSLSQSILITIFTSWIQCLWGGVACCQHIPASGGLLTKAWRKLSTFSAVLSEGSLPGRFLFAADAVSLQFPTHNSTVLPLGTLSFRWVLKCRRNFRKVTTTESLF